MDQQIEAVHVASLKRFFTRLQSMDRCIYEHFTVSPPPSGSCTVKYTVSERGFQRIGAVSDGACTIKNGRNPRLFWTITEACGRVDGAGDGGEPAKLLK